MQRRNILLAGAALVLLLLVVAAAIVLPPALNSGPSPRQPQPTVAQSPLEAEPGDTVVTLTWNAVQGATGYSIYRNGSSIPLNPTPLTSTQYEDIGLSNGRTYTYTVAPLDAAGKPGQSLPAIQVAPGSK